MKILRRIAEEGDLRWVKRPNGNESMQWSSDDMRIMLWDGQNQNDFDPESPKSCFIALLTKEGTVLHGKQLQSAAELKDLIRDLKLVAEYMTFEEAPDDVSSDFALFDKSDNNYCIVATRNSQNPYGLSSFAARSRYLKDRDPESKGLIARKTTLLEAMSSLDYQVNIDAEITAPEMSGP